MGQQGQHCHGCFCFYPNAKSKYFSRNSRSVFIFKRLKRIRVKVKVTKELKGKKGKGKITFIIKVKVKGIKSWGIKAELPMWQSVLSPELINCMWEHSDRWKSGVWEVWEAIIITSTQHTLSFYSYIISGEKTQWQVWENIITPTQHNSYLLRCLWFPFTTHVSFSESPSNHHNISPIIIHNFWSRPLEFRIIKVTPNSDFSFLLYIIMWKRN